MKKYLIKLLILNCVCSIILSSFAFATDSVNNDNAMGALPMAWEIIVMHEFYNRTEEAGFYTENERDTEETYWTEQFKNNKMPENLVLPLPIGTSLDDLCTVLAKPCDLGEEYIPDEFIIKEFEFSKLTSEDIFCTGSVLDYVNESYPFEISVVIRGDIAGGEDTIGDGKVDILDVVKLRYCIINNECEEMRKNNYPMFFASDLSYDDIVDIVDVVTLRKMIIEN